VAQCYYCDEPAREECPTCGRLFCDDHGDDVCVRCMAPASATPPAALYRGSILALLIATAVAIYLLVSPPEDRSRAGDVRTVATVTPMPASTVPAAATQPARTPTAGASPTPQAATPTAPAARTHTVVAGDTLSGIASQFGTTEDAIRAANPGVNLDPLQIGVVLTIP
jgi:hypothetical protein